MSQIKFPCNFLWGGATAPEQFEGHGHTGKSRTVWDKYYESFSNHFHNQVGPEVTSDLINQWKTDIQLFKKMKINSIRIGISWARFMPDGKNISQKGLEFYEKIIAELNNAKIRIVLNLFHFDMPLWAQELGGWENYDVINHYVKYAENVFKVFGNKVDFISTMNEPNVPIMGGYLMKFHWPLLVNNKKAFQVGFGTILAHAKAVNLFNKLFKKNVKAKIGTIINLNPAIAKDNINFSKNDLKAKKAYNILHNWSMIYPMVTGKFHHEVVNFAKAWNLMPNYTSEDLQEIKKVKLDYLGINYYSPTRVQAPQSKNPVNIFDKTLSYFHWNKARYNIWRGWEIRPETIYEIAMYIKKEFDNIPFFIAENGMGVENESRFRNSATGVIEDDYRIAFLQEHLLFLNKAIKEGANCFGYHMWAMMDNWSWRNAYKNRYGFIEVNLKNQTRQFKKSAWWFKTLAQTNQFDSKFKKVHEIIDLKNKEVEKLT